MSTTELAEKVGITMANISVLKNGKAKAIRQSTLQIDVDNHVANVKRPDVPAVFRKMAIVSDHEDAAVRYNNINFLHGQIVEGILRKEHSIPATSVRFVINVAVYLLADLDIAIRWHSRTRLSGIRREAHLLQLFRCDPNWTVQRNAGTCEQCGEQVSLIPAGFWQKATRTN
jgi:hypothetical protein